MRCPAHAARAALLVLVSLTCTLAGAQTYPARPLRLIVPFAPGGSTDIVGRLLGQKLGESLGQQLVIDNRPGAGGNIGTEIAAKSEADGYTLALVTVAYAINPSLHKTLPFDPLRDLVPVGLVASAPNLLTIHPSIPAHTVADFVRIAKQERLLYASAGNGTPTHLAAELFNAVAGIKLEHVPYKGGGPALTDLVAGQVKVMFPGIVSGIPYVKSGRIKALAQTGKVRSSAAPNVPTIAESGYPTYEAVNWYALLVPAGTPAAIVDKLNVHLNKALAAPDLIEKLARDGGDPTPTTPAAAKTHVAREIAKWKSVVAQAGAAVD